MRLTLRRSLTASLFLVLCAVARAEGPAEIGAHPVVAVWPGEAPVESVSGGGAATATATHEVSAKPPAPGRVFGGNVTAVSRPTLTVFPAPPGRGRGTGVGLIVCPGGGYKQLVVGKEGEEAADWLNSIGVTAFVLKYRIPDPDDGPGARPLPALQDVQRAIRLVRSGAAGWGVRPDRIGLIGFSAGANLAALASTRFGERTYAPVDGADAASCRPDFAILAYPGGLVDKGRGGLAPDLLIPKDAPQTFLVQAESDRVNSENSLFYFLGLKRAGVPAEIHIYTVGLHGFGVRPSSAPVGAWTARCAEWMAGQGILPRS